MFSPLRHLFRFELQEVQRDRLHRGFKPRLEWLEDRLAPTVTVMPPPNQGSTEGTSNTFSLGSFSDTGLNNSYNVTVAWGDGTTERFIVFTQGNLPNRTHIFGEEGSFTAMITVTGSDQQPGSGSFTVNVADPNVVASPNSFGAVVNTALNNVTVATFTDPGGPEPNAADPIGTFTDHYSATIDWGDGTGTSAGTFSLSGNTFSVQGSHTYTATGTDHTTVTIRHEATTPQVVSGTVNVGTQALVVTAASNQLAVEGALTSFALGSFSDATQNASPWQIDINWGDSTAHTTFTTNTQGSIGNRSHTYLEEGTPTVTVTVTDNAGVSRSATYQVTVSDPAVVASANNFNTVVNTALNNVTVATFTDPGGPEPNAGDPGPLANHYSATVDWGDGGGPIPATITLSGNTFSVKSSHTFTSTGSTMTTVTINHEANAPVIVNGTVNVAAQALVVTSPGDQSATEGTAITLPLGSFSDATANASTWTVDVNWGDGTTHSGFVAFAQGDLGGLSHTYLEEGSYTVTVTVTDNLNVSSSGTYTANVQDPAVAATALNFAAGANTAFTNQAVATFTDPGGAEPNSSDPGPLSNHYTATIDWGDSSGATTGTIISNGNGTFTVQGSHTYGFAFAYTTTVIITHEMAPSTIVNGQANVQSQAVLVTSPGDQTATEGASTSFPLGTLSDVTSANSWTVEVNWGDGSPHTTYTTTTQGTLANQSHTYAEEGFYTVTVTVTDNQNASGSANYQVTVADPPVVGTPVNFTAGVGAPFSGRTVATFTDPGGAEPNASDPGPISAHYTATIDWGDGTFFAAADAITFSNGVFSVQGSHTYNFAGTYQVNVTITHESTQTIVTDMVTVAVQALVVSSAGNQTAVEGASTSFNPGSFSDSTPNASSWQVDINWGDGSSHTTFSTNTQGALGARTHTYFEEGSYTVTVTITDNVNASGSITFQANVSDPAVVASAVNFPAVINAVLNNQAVATFTDPGGPEPNASDPGAVSNHYTATIDWGDASGITTGTVTQNGTTYTISGSHTYAQTGTYRTTVVITHENAPQTTVNGNVNASLQGLIVTPAGAQTATEGASNSFNMGSFSDTTANANSWTVDINWGDGSAHATFTTASQGSLGSSSHTYGEEGTYTVTITVTDNVNASGSATFQITVFDPAVAASAVNFSSGPGTNLTNQAVATFTDPGGAEPNAFDPGALSNHYSATIDWGDSSGTSAGTITQSGSTYTVSGSHTYSSNGSFRTTVVITHESAPTTTVQGAVNVSNQALVVTPPSNQTATEGASNSFSLGSFSDTTGNATSWTVDVNWGDGSGHTIFTVTSRGSLGNSSHTYGEEGTYTLTVTVTSNANSSGSTTSQVTVSDPAVVAAATNFSAAPNQALSNQTVATFTDPGGAEPNAFDPSGTHYTATINWGDGTSSTATISQSGNTFSVQGNHTYGQAGSFPFTVVITHEGAPTTTVSGTATVSTTTTGVVNFVDFETGDFSQTVSHTNGAIVTSPALDGRFSLQLLRNNSVANVVIRQADKTFYNLPTVFYSFLFQSASQSGEGGIANFEDTNGNYKAALHLSPSGRLILYDINGNPLATGVTPINPNQTYTIAVRLGTGTNAPFEVRVNGAVDMSGSGNFGNNNNGSIRLGGNSAYTTNYYYDDIAINSLGFPGQAPVVTSPGNQTASEGASTTFSLGSFSDTTSNATSWSIDVNWGDGTPDATFTTTTKGSLGTFAHTFGEEGTYTVRVTVSSNANASSSATFQVTVSDPAVVGAANNFSAVANTALTNQTVATFTDPGGAEPNAADPSGTHYTATINWGDGSFTANATITQSGNTFAVSGSHTYAQTGTFTVTVTILHENAPATTVTSMATVSTTTTGVVNFVDFETGDFSQTVSHTNGAIVTSPALDGRFSLQLLRNNSVANVVIRQADKSFYNLPTVFYSFLFQSASQSGEGGIANFEDTNGNYKAALHLSPSGRLILYDINGNPLATGVTPINPNQTYTFAVRLGTGTNAPFEVRVNGAVDMSGSGNFGNNNNGSIRLGGNSAYTTNYYYDDIAINSQGLPGQGLSVTSPGNQTATEGLSTSIALGSFSDTTPNATSWAVDVNWGDGTPDTIFTTASTGSLAAGGHTFGEEGTYTVRVTVTSNANGSASATFQVTVSDPAVVASALNFSAVANTAFVNQAVATFTDPGGPEPNASDPTAGISSHYTAVITWGDGTSTTATISFSGGIFTVQGNHTYGQTGTFTVAVVISHENAPQTTVSGTATVSATTTGVVNFVDFETGDFSQTVSHTNGAIVTSPALDGRFSLQLFRSNSVANVVIRQADKTFYNLPTVFYSFLFQSASQSGEGGIANFEDTNGNYKAGLHLSSSGRLILYDVNGNPLATGITPINQNQTYIIAIRLGTGTNASFEVRVNGAVDMTGSGNFGNNNNGSIRLGGNSAYTTNYYYDDVAINSQGFPGGPMPPAGRAVKTLLTDQAPGINSDGALTAVSVLPEVVPMILSNQPSWIGLGLQDTGLSHRLALPHAAVDSVFADWGNDFSNGI